MQIKQTERFDCYYSRKNTYTSVEKWKCIMNKQREGGGIVLFDL